MHLDTPIRVGNKYRYLHIKGEDILLALLYERAFFQWMQNSIFLFAGYVYMIILNSS